MGRGLIALGIAIVAWVAQPVSAAFHFAHIAEVHTSLNGDPGAQYVEIEMEEIVQYFVENSVLHAWDCAGESLGDLLLVPGNVVNHGLGVRWIMATDDPIGGVAPDFVIPTAGMPVDCGQVCWGAPDEGLLPADPETWDHTDPTNYVDCLAYGGYTGPTHPGSGTPTALVPTDAFSLTRVADTGSNLADFALQCPTPENNDGEIGAPDEPCENPTTTTTTPTTSTTTTTVPVSTIDQPLAATKLVLKAKPGRPDKSKLVLVAKDRSLSIGAGPGSTEDPTTNGGAFAIASGTSPGGAFAATHDLAGDWRTIGKPEAAQGWKRKSKTSVVRLVVVKAGKLVKVKAVGDVGFDLDDDPDPVTVELRLGARRYCFEFGGTPKFKPAKKYVAKKPGAPSSCP
jgi:hypothetical protein